MIYLASPYTHESPTIRKLRWHAACEAAAWLHCRGEWCYCPIAETHGQTLYGVPVEWSGWVNRDRWFLNRCDELYVLCIEGWRESRGIAAELDFWKVDPRPVRWLVPVWYWAAASVGDGYEIRDTEPS